MAGLKTQTLLDDNTIKAIVGIPGWAENFNEGTDGNANTPIGAYGNVPLLYRAVSLRASSISSVPFVIWKNDKEVEYPLFPDLASVIYQMELGLLLTGAAYALKQYKGNTRILVGLQVLNPTTMKWKLKNGENVFSQNVNGKRYGPWEASQMVAMREPSMTADVGPGLSPAQVALSASKLRFNIAEFASAFFEQGGMPMTLISTANNPNTAELERAQSFFKRSLSGINNAWKTLFLRGDISVKTLTPEIKSMAMKELNDHVALDIGAALGVPRSILESDAANYATSVTDMKSFWEMTIRPRLPFYETALNNQLFEGAGNQYRIQFVPEQMDIFQEDESMRANSLLQLVNAGVPLDDAMLMLGYDPLENKPEPQVIDIPKIEVDESANEEQVASELASWERYAIRSLKKPKQRKFEVRYIPESQADLIRQLLQKATNVEEVKAAFEPRRFLGWETYT